MPNDTDYFLSLDVGTSSVKIVLFDVSGTMIAASTQEYNLITPAENLVELYPETYWDCCVKGIRHIVSEIGVDAARRIRSIGVCSQGETLITLGKNNEPLHNAIVWIDNRSSREAAEIKAKYGVNRNTGQPDVYAMWPVTKILWLKKHMPHVFANCRKFLLVEDYIIFRLSGHFVGSYALYTSSYMLDIRHKCWWDEILDFVGINEEQLVSLKESGQVVDTILSSVAEKLNLSTETVVVTGAMDQTAALVGSAAIDEGIVIETTGSALVVCQAASTFPEGIDLPLPVHYHAIPDMYFLLSICSSGGLALKWLRDTFFENEMKEARKTDTDSYSCLTDLAQEVPAGSQGLLFYPYMSGPGTLPVDPDVRGVYYGIEIHHKRGHFIRALMESIAFVIRESLEEMRRLGFNHTELRSLGGGAKSRLWNQIKANVLGCPVNTMKCPESAAMGIAILQAVALGKYPDITIAAKNMVHISEKINPEENSLQAYNSAYEYYRSIEKKYFAL